MCRWVKRRGFDLGCNFVCRDVHRDLDVVFCLVKVVVHDDKPSKWLVVKAMCGCGGISGNIAL